MRIPESLKEMENLTELRKSEIAKMFSPHLKSLDNYKILIIKLVQIIGAYKPSGGVDIAVRNFIADTYDLLDGAVAVIKLGLPNAAAPLIRRIYENVSLMNAFIIDKKLYDKWFRGQEVVNKEVRKVLNTSPAGEALERTQALYYQLSDKAHPSRIAISDRFLGAGNPFTLGPVMTPSVALVSDTLLRLLSLVFWFTACAALYYKPVISSRHSHFIKLYETTSTHALDINEKLAGKLDQLYEEEDFTDIERNPPA